MNAAVEEIDYRGLLESALDPKQEKRLDEAFKAFHNYSILNQILAVIQLEKIAPIATANTWSLKGRKVIEGSQPIKLVVPITHIICDAKGQLVLDDDGKPKESLTGFKYQFHWFSLHQTEGKPLDWKGDQFDIGHWDIELACKTFSIDRVNFDLVNGNIQGFARKRQGKKEISINPLAQYPQAALFHELAHQVLGHLDGYYGDAVLMTNYEKHCLKEVEAESVAFICTAALGLPGLAESRHYIQSYLNKNTLTNNCVKRIFTATNKILKAGFAKT